MENAVAVELWRRTSAGGSEVYYWKDHQQREVDFVIMEGKKKKTAQPIQVCADTSEMSAKELEVQGLFCRLCSLILWKWLLS